MNATDTLRLEFSEPEIEIDVVRSVSWRGFSAEYSRIHMPAEFDFRWSGETHYVALHDLVLIDGETRVEGLEPIVGNDLRDTMTYLPKGCTAEGWARTTDRQNGYVAVYFNPDVLATEVGQAYRDTVATPMIYFDDTGLRSTLAKVGRLLAQGHLESSLYAETLCLMAAMEIVNQQGQLAVPRERSGGLTKLQERRVRDHIEDNLASEVSLGDLAAVAGLSRFHFSRAFKVSFGDPPHKYVTIRRIERAQRMLATTPFTINHVASAMGYKSATQFIRAFRDVTGMTPTEFRKLV